MASIFSGQRSFWAAIRCDYLVGALWWFNDALILGFSLFVGAAAVGAIVGRPFVVQRLSALGLVLPIAFIWLNLTRYLWGLRVATGAGIPLALAALRVNLSLSWVVALACVRGFVEERGVFLRTPKFRGAPAIRELRLVWVETLLGGIGLVLMVGVLLRAGFSFVGLALAALLGWSVLIYGSTTAYALGDPTRAPINGALAQKAFLEVAPRVGRVVRSRPARVGVAGLIVVLFFLGAGLSLESGRAPVTQLPFENVPVGPLQGPIAGVHPDRPGR